MIQLGTLFLQAQAYLLFHFYYNCMNYNSQKLKQRLTFRELLVQKIRALRQIQTHNQTKISYVQAQYIVNQKCIKPNVINFILKQLYQSQFEKKLLSWKDCISDDKFIEDVFYLKRKMVEQQWIGERIKSQQMLEKQQKIKSYLLPNKNEQPVNHRLKMLKDDLVIAENKINMAKSQEQSVALVKRYRQLKQEQNFLKNKKRRLKSLQQQKSAGSISHQTLPIVPGFQDKLQQFLYENLQSKYIKASRYAETSKNDQNFGELINQQSKAKISKLERIFLSFAKKQCKDSMLFGEIQASQNYISLQNFLRIIGQTNIDTLLTLQQRVNIFKVNATFEKRIDFTKFINALIQIAKKVSEKLKVKFDSLFLSNFLQTFVKKAKENYISHRGETINMQDKKNTNYLRTRQQSSYKFKLRSHTGKLLNNISEQLEDRKKEKYQKFKRLKEQSARNSKIARRESLKTSLQPIDNEKELEMQSKMSLKLFEPSSQSRLTSNMKNPVKNTYLSIFKRKKKQQDKYIDNSDLIRHKPNPFQRIEESTEENHTIQMKPKSKEVQDLQKLISIDEDDTFLTSHLSRKPAFLQSLKADKRNQKIHY